MKKKRGAWNKKAQFYLIAAIIISALIIGVAVVSNSLLKQPDFRLKEMRDEIQTESAYVMEYAINSSLGQTEFNALLINFTKTNSDYLGKDKSIYFLFGDENNMTLSGYQRQDKTVRLISGTSSTTITQEAGEFTGSIIPPEDEIIIQIGEYFYDFEITPGKIFYFVISKDIKNEEYIFSG